MKTPAFICSSAVCGLLDRSAVVAAVGDKAKDEIIRAGWPLLPVQSAILPLLVGAEVRAVELATALREQGIFIPAIRYPTVARGAARLRVTLTAAHTAEDVRELAAALNCDSHRSADR